MTPIALPTLCIFVVAVAFLVSGALTPGRELPMPRDGMDARSSSMPPGRNHFRHQSCLALDVAPGHYCCTWQICELPCLRLHRMACRDLRLLLVAPHSPHAGLLGDLSSNPSFARTYRGNDRLLQAPSRNPGGQRAGGCHALSSLLGSSPEGALWFNFSPRPENFFYHFNI